MRRSRTPVYTGDESLTAPLCLPLERDDSNAGCGYGAVVSSSPTEGEENVDDRLARPGSSASVRDVEYAPAPSNLSREASDKPLLDSQGTIDDGHEKRHSIEKEPTELKPTWCERCCCGYLTCITLQKRRLYLQRCGWFTLFVAAAVLLIMQRWATHGEKWNDGYLRLDPGYRYYPIPTASGLLYNGRPLDANGGTGSLRVIPYLAVPYAAPPVGDLRWKPPQPLPADYSERERECHEYSNYCVQADGAGSEDCLYMNIYVPEHVLENMAMRGDEVTAPPLPVMLLLHGGGLTFGTGAAVSVWGATGARGQLYEPVIGITINYRLNMFGWLAARELSLEQDGTSGNYGLQDMQMALQWVQDNIEQFGGDPQRVTVMGQSSGGTGVMALMSSPLSIGLFNRAVSMSGSPNITMDLATAEQHNAPLVDGMGCGPASDDQDYTERLACLRALPQHAITGVMPESWYTPGIFGLPPGNGIGGRNYPGLPVVDGVVIATNFQDALATDVVPGVTLVLGNMGYEPDGGPDEVVDELNHKEWTAFLEDRFESFEGGATEQIMSYYADDLRTGGPQKAYDAISADTGLTCGTAASALSGAMGNYSGDIYLYVNNWHPGSINGVSIVEKEKGMFKKDLYLSWYARHGWDETCWTQAWKEFYWPRQTDRDHSDTLRTAFYHLAAYGDMRAVGWTPVDETNQWPDTYATFVIEPQYRLVESYKADVCEYYDSIGVDRSYWWSD